MHRPRRQQTSFQLLESKSYKHVARTRDERLIAIASDNHPVRIPIVRNAVGTLKDISENFVTYPPRRSGDSAVQSIRFNYHSAIFSPSGYTVAAQRFAIAHQVFLIQYQSTSLMQPIVNALLRLSDTHLSASAVAGTLTDASRQLRQWIRALLDVGSFDQEAGSVVLSDLGNEYIQTQIVFPLKEIGGSYFAMLNGKWPMHLLATAPLPPEPFARRDEIRCKVYRNVRGQWVFAPSEIPQGTPGWFELEFDIPEEVLTFLEEVRDDPVALAALKKVEMAYLSVAGRIDGIFRRVILRLDRRWLRGLKSETPI